MCIIYEINAFDGPERGSGGRVPAGMCIYTHTLDARQGHRHPLLDANVFSSAMAEVWYMCNCMEDQSDRLAEKVSVEHRLSPSAFR